MSSVQESKEMMAVINRALPNVSMYIRVILKREKLSEEAESMRARYDSLLSALEQGSGVNHLRPVSIIGDDDSGYFSGNRTRVSELLDQPKGLPGICHSGYLLRRDDKYRWHRSWCKADSKEMKLFIYEDLNEEILIRSFSLDGVSTRFGPHPVPDSDKENSFAICGIGIAIEPLIVPTTESNESNGLVSPAPPTSTGSSTIDEAYFAAYSESDYRQWKDVLHMLTSSRESSRISLSYLDNAQWLGTHDSTSTSSSSFGSNRESMISTTSSVNRNSAGKMELSEVSKLDPPTGSGGEDMRKLSAAKQQQPLPSPPHVPHVLPQTQTENVPLPDDDDDNASEGTIYESIDNLVSQFDDAMRATAAAMGQIGQNMKSGGKKRKKKLTRQTSFLTRTKSGSKSNFLTDKKSELERGDRYTGYLFKKTSSGSWKKRWCTLKGCVFGYYKGPEEGHGREYVVLDAEVNRVNDPKRSFAFSLMCKGVEEMFLAAEDDHLYEAWMARLDTASRNHGEYSDAWNNWQSEENLVAGGSKEEGIYSVPRSSLPLDNLLIPRAATTMTPERAIETGIYSVPKFLLEPMTTPTNGVQGNVSDIYDVPRASVSPDEEGIYDDPYDILDMEIYDYPPDVTDLYRFLEESSLDTPEHSTRASTITVTTDRTSSTISEDSWRTMSLPPLPPGARPFSVISSDEYQSNRNSVVSIDSSYTLPRNHAPLDLHSIVERPLDSPSAPDYPDTTSLEFGQCIIRGHLYKKERLTWTKLYCIIRNNFLECHKSQGGGYVPALKLFLPGSDIKPGGGDSKHRHALQVKHPRRDGMLVFATETVAEYPQWVKAFQSGASIQVQAVSNVEEMRISDLEMKRRWTVDSREPPSNDTEGWNGTLPRRKTYSNDNKSTSTGTTEEYSTDTLKRRRRFTLGKLTKKKDKKMASTPELKRPPIAIPPVNFIQDSRRSVSCEELPGAVELAAVMSHQTTGPDGLLRFQGYLSVHRYGANTNFIRYWCVFDGTLISCFINQMDLTLTMSVTLPGSQISEASTEAGRPHAFKVWHMETGQCIFFAADDEREFNQWFTVVTQNADQIPTPQQGGGKVVFFVVPGSDLRVKSFHVRQRSNSLPTSPVEEGTAGDTGSTASGNTGHGSNDTPVNTFYRGHLKKASNSHSGKWKERYCVVKDGLLSLYHSQGDKAAITSIDLLGCSIELVAVPRSSAYKLVFKVNLSSDKAHTFAAPSETEMYAWVSALRDSSYESQTQSQTELSTGGSNNSSPALSGKASLRKKMSKAKLPEVDLISYVVASTLTNPVISGFADVQVSPESWSRFWCVLHGDCLYIYQTQQSTATVKTVVLPGYEIHVADPLIYKRQYAILLNHNGVAPVCMAVNDELELNQWLSALDRGARAEGLNSKSEKRTSKPLLDEKALGSSAKVTSRGSVGGSNKKGPVRADHTISTIKDGGSVDSIPSSVIKSSEAHQDSVIRRFEKRIRKTHRVANQTEQKLKEHQTALLHFKKELSRHLVKLKELSESGEASAKRRLDDVRKKLAQVDKIVPYLGKYVAVNRQAEGQTVAVLKECCTMEIQKMARSSIYPETSTPKENRSKSVRDHTDTVEEQHDKLVKKENPYASLTEIMPEVIKAKSNYAQLDFSRVPSPGGSMRSPSVDYAEVQIGSSGKGVILNGSATNVTNHSTIAVALGDESSVPTEGASEGDVTLTPENAATITLPTPRHLETVQEVSSTPPPSPSHPPPRVPPPPPPAVAPTPPTVPPPPPPTVAPTPPTVPPPPPPAVAPTPPTVPPPVPTPPTMPPPAVVPTPPTELPEVVPPPSETFELPPSDIPIVPPPPVELMTTVDVSRRPTVPQRSSSLEPSAPTSTDSSPTHTAPTSTFSSPSHKPPPKVARKPPKSVNGHIEGAERETTSPARQNASSVLSSVPSVMDRIKALHGKP